MSPTPHKRNRIIVVPILKRHLVRNELVVQTRLRQGFGRRETPVDDVDDVLHGGSDYAASACGAGDEEEGAVGVGYEHGGCGGEGAFSGLDVVGFGWDVAEAVGCFGDGEIVHFIIHDDACLGDHEFGSE